MNNETLAAIEQRHSQMQPGSWAHEDIGALLKLVSEHEEAASRLQLKIHELEFVNTELKAKLERFESLVAGFMDVSTKWWAQR